MILDEIQTALETVDSKVFYGMVDDTQVSSDWNYIVFLRKRMSIGGNKQEYSDRYTVAIVRENYIPVELPERVIDAMCKIAGMRVASTDCEYSYTQKPNTNTVVELVTIEFVRARKRVVS